MSESSAFISLFQQAVILGIKISLPILAFAVVIGMLIGIFQSVTQIQDASLAFVPKLAAVSVSIFFFGPWILNSLAKYCAQLFLLIPQICLIK